METLRNPAYAGIIWLIARLWLGYEWLHAGIGKVFGEGSAVWVGDKAGVAVNGFLQGAIERSPLAAGFDSATAHPEVKAWYAYLVQNVFQPNAPLFSYLVAYGEVLVGIALIIGLFTHFSAVMGVLMNLAFLLAGTSSSNPLMLVVGLTIVLVGGAAVGYYGLDRFARPIEINLMRRARQRILHAPQPA